MQASNPGQFENDMEVVWSKGKAAESIYHAVSNYSVELCQISMWS